MNARREFKIGQEVTVVRCNDLCGIPKRGIISKLEDVCAYVDFQSEKEYPFFYDQAHENWITSMCTYTMYPMTIEEYEKQCAVWKNEANLRNEICYICENLKEDDLINIVKIAKSYKATSELEIKDTESKIKLYIHCHKHRGKIDKYVEDSFTQFEIAKMDKDSLLSLFQYTDTVFSCYETLVNTIGKLIKADYTIYPDYQFIVIWSDEDGIHESEFDNTGYLHDWPIGYFYEE